MHKYIYIYTYLESVRSLQSAMELVEDERVSRSNTTREAASACVCMCVCMCVCAYVYVCYMCVYACLCVYVCVFMCMCAAL
jgi:hypothetical protein